MVLGVRSILRLSNPSRTPTFSSCRYLNYQLHKRFNDERAQNELKSRFERDVRDKILYNSQLHGENHCYTLESERKKKAAAKENRRRSWLQRQEPVPFSLSYFYDRPAPADDPTRLPPEESDSPFRLPYGGTAKILEESYGVKSEVRESADWMTDYEFFDDARLKRSRNPVHKIHAEPTAAQMLSINASLEDEREAAAERIAAEGDWQDSYGRPDPTAAVGRVPCDGCGALLHCNDTGLPGYLPGEIYKCRSESELRSMVCQRCHFLKEYNVALDLKVDPEEYVRLLERIRPRRGLVLLLVDLLDFPCSVWPGMLDIIGEKRPVVVVGNKVDLLPRDSNNYLANVESSLRDAVVGSDIRHSNIKHVALVSAKTGYGIEKLINKLHSLWEYRGDVYLLGCANSGKSTLFNALLRSDYCKVAARDLVKRATVSHWPGTTLDFLKFPILRPSNWRLMMRFRRLSQEKKQRKLVEEERMRMLKDTNKSKYATLVGYIGQTFEKDDEDEDDNFSSPWKRVDDGVETHIDETSLQYRNSRWCFDTPGVVQPEQILNLLTLEELLLTIPKYQLRPRTFWIKRGMTLFVAGLARLDVLESENPLQLTAFASADLPVTVCRTEDAEEIYARLSNTTAFVVPFGSEERMKNWPGLKRGRSFRTVGQGKRKSSADVVLSSAGWVAVSGWEGQESELAAWTPGARGIHLRTPALLPYALNLKGPRMGNTPAYRLGSPFKKTGRNEIR